MLDLGQVDTMAEFTLNGKTFPALWKSPYQVDIASAIKASENQLDVCVAKVWHNRLVGKIHDEAAIGGPPVHASTMPRYGKDQPLLSSGLIGPVTVGGAVVAPQFSLLGIVLQIGRGVATSPHPPLAALQTR